ASSYTWGPSTPTFPVLVDGRTLRVTANAHTLLRDMSSYLLPRLLWIDSICINQKDEAEKSAQVQLMQAIYHRASIVTIWLSHEGAGHAYGTAVMPRTEAELMGLMNTWRTYPQWPSLITLVSNPWFQRIWVVQEAVIARNVRVVYSGVEIDWKTFA
ncbi:heterokaryon incompatibility, partial [Thozetella sp. PMI_491]